VGKQLSGSGQLIHRGRAQGLSEAFLFDQSDALISHGTSRCSVFPPIDPLPDPPELPVPDEARPGSDPADRCAAICAARSCAERVRQRSGWRSCAGSLRQASEPPSTT
jgi:hypothetical protein